MGDRALQEMHHCVLQRTAGRRTQVLSQTHWPQGTALPGVSCVAPGVSYVSLLSFCFLMWTQETTPRILKDHGDNNVLIRRDQYILGGHSASTSSPVPPQWTSHTCCSSSILGRGVHLRHLQHSTLWFISQIFMDQLVWARHYCGCWGNSGRPNGQSPRPCSAYTVILLIFLLQLVNKHINKRRPKGYKTRQCDGNDWGNAALGRGVKEGLWNWRHFNSVLNKKGLALGRSEGRAFLEEGAARIKTLRQDKCMCSK